MTIPTVQFPVAHDDIPAEVKKLDDFIKARTAELDIARKLIRMVREGCPHTGAETGFNERDGSWMNPCPHCGDTK